MGTSSGGPSKDAAPVVSVFGASHAEIHDGVYRSAWNVGRVLAELGYTIANGGYGGTMEAAALGARQAGGRTIGVTCSIWDSPPNSAVDEVIQTTSLSERLDRLIGLGRAGYVVLPGATGTLLELAMAWEMICKKQLSARPLVIVGRFWQGLVGLMASMGPRYSQCVCVVDDPAELARHFPRVKSIA